MRGYFDLVPNATVVYLRLRLGRAPDDLVSKDGFVDDTVVGAGCREVLVIDVTILGGVDSNKVTSLLVLLACLTNHVAMPKGDRLTHTFMDGGHVLLWVLGDILLDHRKGLLSCCLRREIATCCTR